MIINFSILVVINLLVFLNLEKISKFIDLYDFPNKKLKKHKNKVSLIGGTIIILNLFLFYVFSYFIDYKFFIFFQNAEQEIIFFIVIFLFYSLGFYDDKINLNPYIKLLISIIIITVYLYLDQNLIIQNFSVSIYQHKIFLETYSIFFSIFCFIILINALNFYDGINGQSLIFFLSIFLYLLIISENYKFYGFLIFIVVFLLFLNLQNKLFLGDNGIYVLAIILSTSIIYEHNVFGNFDFVDEIFLLLILPGYDLLRLTISRIISGRNALYGDRNHIHHLLIDKFSLLWTNIILLVCSSSPIILYSIFNLSFVFILFIYTFLYLILIYKIFKK